MAGEAGERAKVRATNWAGNVSFLAGRHLAPTSLDHLRELVTGGERIKVIGAGHSFSTVADTTGVQLSLHRLPAGYRPAADRRSVWVAAGMRLSELSARLNADGLALPTLPSLSHVTVAGAVLTGTHGSGYGCQTLAGSVTELELLTADGSTRTAVRGTELLDAAVVSMGALGVVTGLRLAVLPTFDVAQTVYVGLEPSRLPEQLARILATAYSVSVFTDWRGDVAAWVKRRIGDPVQDLDWAEARPADRPRHPIAGQSPEHCTTQLGLPGPWHRRLPHFRPEFSPSVGAELQSEYLVDIGHAGAALRAVAGLAEVIAPLLHICELRTVRADRAWLSPCHQRDSLALHFTWRVDTARQRAGIPGVLAELERRLAVFDARPHWGKVCTVPPEVLTARYPRLRDFARLRAELDPAGTFANAFLDAYFPP